MRVYVCVCVCVRERERERDRDRDRDRERKMGAHIVFVCKRGYFVFPFADYRHELSNPPYESFAVTAIVVNRPASASQ